MSGFVLPRYVGGSARGWELADYVEVEKSTAAAGADGIVLLELPQLDAEERWLLDHAVTSCTSTTVTDLRYYVGAIRDTSIVEQTDNGNFDVADWPNGLRVGPSGILTLRWGGCSAGAIGTANLQIRVLRRAS